MNEIATAQRRAQGYWFVDGFAEMAGGVVLALCGALLYAAVRTGIDWLSTAALGVLILGFPVTAWVVRALKERITYPRTGFVAYAPPSRTRMFIAAAVGFVTAGLLAPIMAVSKGGTVSIVVLGFGVLVGAVLAVRAWRTGMPRFYVMAAAVVAFSGVMSTSESVGVQDAIGILMLFEGLVLLANGAWTLLNYLKHTDAVEGGAA